MLVTVVLVKVVVFEEVVVFVEVVIMLVDSTVQVSGITLGGPQVSPM